MTNHLHCYRHHFGTSHPLYIKALLHYCHFSSDFKQDKNGVQIAKVAECFCCYWPFCFTLRFKEFKIFFWSYKSPSVIKSIISVLTVHSAHCPEDLWLWDDWCCPCPQGSLEGPAGCTGLWGHGLLSPCLWSPENCPGSTPGPVPWNDGHVPSQFR